VRPYLKKRRKEGRKEGRKERVRNQFSGVYVPKLTFSIRDWRCSIVVTALSTCLACVRPWV
jgi:hypothetical protein